MTITKTIPRAEAVKELRETYGLLAQCQENWLAANTQGRWAPPDYIADDIMSDVGVYSDRIRELEAFLASEPVKP